MAFFKYELMLKYIGIKASILNPRAESIFDQDFGYSGFYMRYLNLDTNQEELAKVKVDVQKSGYKEFSEIYKAADQKDEQAINLKNSLAKVLSVKAKDIFIYASYPIVPVSDEIVSLRNFKVKEQPDKYYFDVSKLKESDKVLEFLGVDKTLLGDWGSKVNYIISFDAKTLEKAGLYYTMLGSQTELSSLCSTAPFIDTIVPRDDLISALDVLVEKSLAEWPENKLYVLGIQKTYGDDEKSKKFRKFVFSSIPTGEQYISYFGKD